MSKLQGNTPEQSEKNDSLNRSLSHGQLTMIAMGLALGTGLFLGSSSAIKIAGPGAILSYAIGSMIAATIAACAVKCPCVTPSRAVSAPLPADT